MNASGQTGASSSRARSAVFQRARGQFNGYGFNLPTQDLVDEFETGDPRLSHSSSKRRRDGRPRLSAGCHRHAAPVLPQENFNNAEEAPFGDPNPNGHTNDRVIRLSDIMLFHAEACVNTGRPRGQRHGQRRPRPRP